ncbi:MAG TPA: DUF5050 domain-containing protein [Feifaniaceae bacterium]|nr:DUF5050 domain-containing protein [Feifaniaceae bacterium]
MADLSYYEKLCAGCMKTRGKQEGPCEHCGWEASRYVCAPHHLPLRSIVNGKYLVGRVLGEGGFGITYIGFDLNLELRVAIKEYFPSGMVTRQSSGDTRSVTPFTGEAGEQYKKGLERFVGEAKILAKFYALPGIVSVKDYFRENGTAYIVMEYVDGVTLKQTLKDRGGRLPAEETLSLMTPVMESLAQVHGAGLIHRDISPDNIMLTERGAKLIDFGAAREYASEEDRSRSVIFKMGYAPWEQYQSRGEQGPWTDVYALCATIYKCVTGETPPEALERMGEDPLLPPSRLGVSIPPQVEGALLKGLAVMKKDRYQDIPQLARALRGMASESHAEPGTGSEQKPRKAMPKWLWPAAGSAAALALVLLLARNGGGKDPGADALSAATTPAPTPAAEAVATPESTPETIASLAPSPAAAPLEAAPAPIAESGAGNTPGNSINAGLAAEYNGSIYYASRGDSYHIHRMNADGSGDIALNDTNSWNLNIADGTIYFSNDSDGNRIYRMGVNGGPYERLSEDACSQMRVADGYIYYRNASDRNRLYRMRTDGTENERLYGEPVEYFNIADGYAYFAASDNGGRVAKLALDSGEAQMLTEPEMDGGYLNVADGCLYFCGDGSNGMIVRYDTQGAFDASWDEYELSSYINVAPDGYVYFYCYKDWNGTPGIYRSKYDGSEAEQLVEAEGVWNINVAGGWIFYRVNEFSGDDQTMYRVRTDGTGKELIG